jgi:hypothetical protein
MKTFSNSKSIALVTLLLSYSFHVMKTLDTHITIGQYTFTFVVETEVESGFELLADTATLTLPRRLQFKGKAIAQGESLFRRGDPGRVKHGYDRRLDTIFEGYLSRIFPGVPLRFEAQDAMWLLKQRAVTQSYKQVSLQQVLGDICPIPFLADDVELGQFRISNATVAQVLDELRQRYGLYAYIRQGSLIAGLPYQGDPGDPLMFDFEQNIIDDELEYLRADSIAIKVRAISMQPENSKITVELGDDEGDLRTLYFYNLNQEQLLEAAQRTMDRLKVEGYRGSFTTFGQPHVRHGNLVHINDPQYPDRRGTYFVKKVITRCGLSGYRQHIYLDTKHA